MGRQDGLIPLIGTVGNFSFYKSQDGYLFRKKSGVSRERIMSDRAYAPTRKNIAEFGNGARTTKLLRRAFAPAIGTVADNRVTSRLTSRVMKVIKSDAIHAHGERKVAHGDVTLLEDFEFNKHAALTKTFRAPFTATIDRATGTMRVDTSAFIPDNLVSAPEGATHFRLKAFGVAIDFETDEFLNAMSESAYLPLVHKQRVQVTLSHTIATSPATPLLLAFGIEFVQIVKNGTPYELDDNKYNAMAIVCVDEAQRAEPPIPTPEIKQRTLTPRKRLDRAAMKLSRFSRKRQSQFNSTIAQQAPASQQMTLSPCSAIQEQPAPP